MGKPQGITIRLMTRDDIQTVIALVTEVFNTHVAPEYSSAGCEEFYRFASKDGLLTRLQSNQATFVAIISDKIYGITEIRPPNHISLLFVDTAQQRMGLGKALFAHARFWITENYPNTRYISVNASPNAQNAYIRWGFEATHSEQEYHGIRFIPMLYHITP